MIIQIPASAWIPVRLIDHIPLDDFDWGDHQRTIDVLATDGSCIFTAYAWISEEYGVEWRLCGRDGYDAGVVTHWMLLPPPPPTQPSETIKPKKSYESYYTVGGETSRVKADVDCTFVTTDGYVHNIVFQWSDKAGAPCELALQVHDLDAFIAKLQDTRA